MDEIALEDIVERWHNGEWSDKSLEDVIRDITGWDHDQYGRWVARGTFPKGPTFS